MAKNVWEAIPKRPLPPEIAGLPTVVAKPWAEIDPDPGRAGLEGPIFDREGNFYVCHSSPHDPSSAPIMKITPAGEMNVFYEAAPLAPVGIAVHRDGRLFAACLGGEILILSPGGKALEILKPDYDGSQMVPDDLVFDFKGNLYFTDMRGDNSNPIGSVFRLDSDNGYSKPTLISGGLGAPNGISFTPEQDALWIGESGRNMVTRLNLTPDGLLADFNGVMSVYMNTGWGVPDSNKVDSKGNLYQPIMMDGRLIILNAYGIPVGNVLLPGRDEGKHLMSPNLVIKPGTDEAYFVAAGTEGSWVFRFQAIAEAQLLYSHT